MEKHQDAELEQQVDSSTAEKVGRIEHTSDSVIVHLAQPVTFKASKLDGERTVGTLTLPRCVKGKHLKAMDKVQGEMSKTLALIAALASIPVQAADELDGRDVDLAMQAIEPFLPKLHGTGMR